MAVELWKDVRLKTGINQTTLLKLLGYEKVLPREIFETGTFFFEQHWKQPLIWSFGKFSLDAGNLCSSLTEMWDYLTVKLSEALHLHAVT
jgi:hypothetical protein